jgi:serine/threonine-protein kinase
VRGQVVDGRADQFALGVVAYRMLTGHTLFGDHSLATMAYKIVNEMPPLARSHNTQLPPAVDSVLAKALAKDPQDRYGKCADFADALAVALTGADAHAGELAGASREAPTVAMPPMGSPVAPNTTVEKRASKWPVLAAAGVAIVAAVAGGALWKPWASSAPVVTKSVVTASAVQPAAEPANQPAAQPGAPAVIPPSRPEPPTPGKTAEAAPVRAAKSEEKAAPVESKRPTPASPPTVPVSAEDAFAQGRELMKNQDYNGAVQAFSKAADLRPNWGQPYHSRGNAYQALGQNEAAIRDYSHAIRINPAMPNFLLSRANCYIKCNRTMRRWPI